MSFELLMNTGDSVEGVDFPVSFFMSMAVNNRGQHAIMGRALGPDNTVPQQWFILNDQQLLLGPHMTNLPVEINGQSGLARLRSIQGVLDMNNRGDVVTPALPTNFAVPGELSPQGVYIANRNGTVDRVVSVDEPLSWWTGGLGDFANVGFRPRISDDDRVLIEGNATQLGGSSVTHVSRFDRTPGSIAGSSDFVHTNVAAHGMPVAGGVYIGGGFASTMATNGRIVLSSLASLPAPDGFGYKLFDGGVPVLQQGQPAPVQGYFIQDIYAVATNQDGDATMGMGLSLVAGGDEVERIEYSTARGVLTASPGLAAVLGVGTIDPDSSSSNFYMDARGNTYATQDRIMPDGEFIRAIWKNSEPLLTLGMDIGDGRTITEFGSRLDVSDNGRWLIMRPTLSDGSNGPLRVYVPTPSAGCLFGLATLGIARRRSSAVVRGADTPWNLNRLHTVLGQRGLDLRPHRPPSQHDVQDWVGLKPRLIRIGHRNTCPGERGLEGRNDADRASARVAEHQFRRGGFRLIQSKGPPSGPTNRNPIPFGRPVALPMVCSTPGSAHGSTEKPAMARPERPSGPREQAAIRPAVGIAWREVLIPFKLSATDPNPSAALADSRRIVLASSSDSSASHHRPCVTPCSESSRRS